MPPSTTVNPERPLFSRSERKQVRVIHNTSVWSQSYLDKGLHPSRRVRQHRRAFPAIPENISLRSRRSLKPLQVKPLYEGSSKGVKDNSLVRSIAELRERVGEVIRQYRQPVIVERFLPGREFTVGFLGNGPGLEILPVVEIDHAQLPRGAAPIYSYEAKWIWDTTEKPLAIFKCPAGISPELQTRIDALIRKVVRILRLKDWGRIDLRLDEQGEPQIIEVNPLPGILPNPDDNSCLPKAARAAGYQYNQLIHRVVEAAAARHGLAS